MLHSPGREIFQSILEKQTWQSVDRDIYNTHENESCCRTIEHNMRRCGERVISGVFKLDSNTKEIYTIMESECRRSIRRRGAGPTDGWRHIYKKWPRRGVSFLRFITVQQNMYNYNMYKHHFFKAFPSIKMWLGVWESARGYGCVLVCMLM